MGERISVGLPLRHVRRVGSNYSRTGDTLDTCVAALAESAICISLSSRASLAIRLSLHDVGLASLTLVVPVTDGLDHLE